MNQLSNDYRQCQLINLEPQTPGGPYMVVQKAFDWQDPNMRMAVFFLQQDGCWIEEIAHSLLPEERRYDIVFDTLGDVMETLEGLSEPPEVERVTLTPEQIQTYLHQVQEYGSMEALIRGFLQRYRTTRTVA